MFAGEGQECADGRACLLKKLTHRYTQGLTLARTLTAVFT
jgi:hypothetical protein